MKEPKKISMSNKPIKEIKKYNLSSIYDITMKDDVWINTNENNRKNNSQSIQELESDKTN
jgi:hypothetical protein